VRPNGVLVASFSALLAVAPAAQQTPSISDVLERTGAYLEQFIECFTNVVAEERYVQEVNARVRLGRPEAGGQRRDSRADFLLVRPEESAEWLPFRDVFEVDGVAVRDRDERLSRLFLKPWTTAIEQANQIAADSSRYNLGPLTRTFNNPVLALAILQIQHRSRLKCSLDRRDADAGPRIWIVECVETSRPTFITGAKDRDIPARCHYWIDVESGQITRTEVALEDPAAGVRLATTFKQDNGFDVAVPSEMREEYNLGDGRKIRATATYGRFRRFEVSATEVFEGRR
jgi:hypothetical protein